MNREEEPDGFNGTHTTLLSLGKSIVEGILGLLLLGGLLLGVNWVALSVFGTRTCLDSKTVKTIGGCDSSGNCGVEFSDSTSGYVTYPVVGKESCVRWSDKSW